MAALKLSIAAKDGGLPLESSVSSAKDLQTDDNNSSSGTEVSDTETESESDDEFPSSTMKTIKMTCNRLMLTIPQRHTNIRRYRMTA